MATKFDITDSVSLSTEDIKILLLRKKVTIADLARRLGTTRPNLSMVIHGLRGSPVLRDRLCVEIGRLLGVKLRSSRLAGRRGEAKGAARARAARVA